MELVGPAYAKEIFFTARHFSAAEAHGMGLINRVVPVEELEAYVRDMCMTIADNAPLTIKSIKKNVAELSRESTAADLAACDELVKACFASADYIEGRRAFMEKRRPAFRGR
jgi:enoyl-CoA hydratase/carnithine racemase